jgi:hypothetical protein
VPKYKAARFVISVYAGGVKIDGKNQGYEPHGSVNPARAARYSGQIFELSGSATLNDDVLSFSAKCRLV